MDEYILTSYQNFYLKLSHTRNILYALKGSSWTSRQERPIETLTTTRVLLIFPSFSFTNLSLAAKHHFFLHFLRNLKSGLNAIIFIIRARVSMSLLWNIDVEI